VTDSYLKEYYAERAPEYEKVYAKPERQEDLLALRKALQDLLAGHDVLEIACGTGYWTQPISQPARSVVATDAGEEVLRIARAKSYPQGNVTFRLADAFKLEEVPGSFTAGFAGFFWSHVELSRLGTFLEGLHHRLGPGALVVIIDNSYVSGSNHPISRQDGEGNTYQVRRLEDGREYEVLKTFPSEAELRQRLQGLAEDVHYLGLTYYWCLSYRIATEGN
jgi:SAM-dependent methyltransferase